jgi:hypothetical protein
MGDTCEHEDVNCYQTSQQHDSRGEFAEEMKNGRDCGDGFVQPRWGIYQDVDQLPRVRRSGDPELMSATPLA